MARNFNYVRLSLACLSLLTISLLSGCGLEMATPANTPTAVSASTIASDPTAALPTPPKPNATTATSASPTPTPLPVPQGEIVVWDQLGQDQDTWLQGQAAVFQKSYPQVHLTFKPVEAEGLSNRLSATGKDGPQLVIAPVEMAPLWQRDKSIISLDSLLDPNFSNNFDPGSTQGLRIEGKAWGMPFSFGHNLMLFYNKKLITPDQVPGTWEALTAYARANPAKKSTFYPVALDLYDPRLLLGAMGAYKGSPLDQNNQPHFNSVPLIQAFQFLQDNLYRYKLITPEPSYLAGQLLFRTGQVALILAGDENLNDYQDPKWKDTLDVGVAPLPLLNSTSLTPPASTLAYFVGSNVSADSGKLAAVQAFLTYVAQPDQQRDLFIQLKLVPASKSLLADPLIKTDPFYGPIALQLQNSHPNPPVPAWKDYYDALRQPISAVIADRASAADAAAALQDLALKANKKFATNTAK